MSERPTDPIIIAPRHALRGLLWIVVGMAAMLGITLLLPDDPYIRYQQANGSDLYHLQWIYERIHYDRTPVDVAVVGTSRLEAGVSPVALSDEMSAIEHRKVDVSDLSLFQSGRDLAYAIVKRLVQEHPETRMVVLSLDEDVEQSHPLFKYVADPIDLATAPFGWNRMYFANLFFLPYRRISYAVQELAPSHFGVNPVYSPGAYLGTDLDRTLGYRTPEGDPVNGNQTEALPKMLAHAHEVVVDHVSGLHHAKLLPADAVLPIERGSVRRIVDLCRAHGILVVFLHLPVLGTPDWPSDRNFYAQQGTILAPDITEFATSNYVDGVHLNRGGALIATRWLAPKLAALDAQRPAAHHAT
jgi:hypothetical protein